MYHVSKATWERSKQGHSNQTSTTFVLCLWSGCGLQAQSSPATMCRMPSPPRWQTTCRPCNPSSSLNNVHLQCRCPCRAAGDVAGVCSEGQVVVWQQFALAAGNTAAAPRQSKLATNAPLAKMDGSCCLEAKHHARPACVRCKDARAGAFNSQPKQRKTCSQSAETTRHELCSSCNL